MDRDLDFYDRETGFMFIPDHELDTHKEWGVPLTGTLWSVPKCELARGTYGVVYKSMRVGSDEVVAIKEITITPKSGMDKQEIKKEANSYNMFNTCPNVIKAFDRFSNKAGDKVYIVLEFCNRGTLEDEIKKRKDQRRVFDAAELKDFATQVLTGLATLHEHGSGFCHLDLKPANIGMDEKNMRLTFKLLDFGFLYQNGDFDDYEIGTTGFKAPEIVSSDSSLKRNTQADIFSFGCVLYEAAFLKNLFEEIVAQHYTPREEMGEMYLSYDEERREKQEVFYRVLNEQNRIDFPNENFPLINELIEECLKVDPESRPTARGCLERLGVDFSSGFLSPLGKKYEESHVKLMNTEYLEAVAFPAGLGEMKTKMVREISERNLVVQQFNSIHYSFTDYPVERLETREFVYFGQVNRKGERHGKGACWDVTRQELYFGFFEDGEKRGTGCSAFTNEATVRLLGDLQLDTYVGKFEGGLFWANHGRLSFEGGVRYSGQFERGEISGQGMLEYWREEGYYTHTTLFSQNRWKAKGELEVRMKEDKVGKRLVYKGAFRGEELIESIVEGTLEVDGVRVYKSKEWTSLWDGRGEIEYFDDGRKELRKVGQYSGGWVGLKREGEGGVYIQADGREKYEGGFKGGFYEGKGKLEKSLVEYEGGFKQGIYEGKGRLTRYRDEQKREVIFEYVGGFEGGQYEDEQGRMEDLLEGVIYEGRFENGKKEGKGVMRFVKGEGEIDEFVGEFKDEEMWRGKVKYKNGNVYEGYLKDKRRCGEGKMEYAPQEKVLLQYEGMWKDDLFDGKGTLYKKNYDYYKGDFKEGKMNGTVEMMLRNSGGEIKGRFVEDRLVFGKQQFDDGSYYIGSFNENMKMHGRGSYSFNDGTQYSGDFDNGTIKGSGLMNYGLVKKDMIYEGEFEYDGQKHGKGELRCRFYQYFGQFKKDAKCGQGFIMFLPDSDSPFLNYEGNFEQDEIKGEGTFIMKSKFGEIKDLGSLKSKPGDILRGEFSNLYLEKKKVLPSRKWEGEPVLEDIYGSGEILYENGSRFEGEIRRGVASGEGVLDVAGVEIGYRYTGMFDEGLPHGKGGILFINGDRFEGRMEKGDMSCGKYEYSDGKVYVGAFKDFLIHGRGRISYVSPFPMGQVWYEGEFERAKYEGEGKIQFENGDEFRGEFKRGRQKGKGDFLWKGERKRVRGDFLSLKAEGMGEMADEIRGVYYLGPFKQGEPHTSEKGGTEGEFYFGKVDAAKMECGSKDVRYYKGQVFEGKILGKGLMVNCDGSVYEGMFGDGNYSGFGVLKYPDGGGRLEGDWDNGKLVSNNRSRFVFDDSDSRFIEYRGEFYKGKFEGIGVLRFKDGRAYEGEFYRGEIYGKGKILNQFGKKVFEGYFQKGKKHGDGINYGENGISIVSRKKYVNESFF